MKTTMIRKFTLLYVFLLASLVVNGQGIVVKSMGQNINDLSASTNPRMDENGNPCGLVKVKSLSSDLRFKGQVVGEVENKVNEYWVYMAQGSKELRIIHPNFFPVDIDFSTYGIGGVDSKSTYVLSLTEKKYDAGKTSLKVIVKPATALLKVDGILIDGNESDGYYQLYLPKGPHTCKVEQIGYRPYAEVVTTGKEPQSITVDLESIMSELEIISKTATAQIYLDGELKGNGQWKGAILPGEHSVEVRQDNFKTEKRNIMLEEKENKAITIPELSRLKQTVRITTHPKRVPITVDGQKMFSPVELQLETGMHYVSIKIEGYEPYRKEFELTEQNNQNITIQLQPEKRRKWESEDYYRELLEEYNKAYEGDVNVIEDFLNDAYSFYVRKGGEGDKGYVVFWLKVHPDIVGWMQRQQEESNETFEELVEHCRKYGEPELALKIEEFLKLRK